MGFFTRRFVAFITTFAAVVALWCRSVVAVSASVNPTVDMVFLDLSNMATVRAAAEEVVARHSARRFDVVVTNAAVVPAANTMTVDGFELMFQVNFLGHAYLLMRLLSTTLSTGNMPPPPLPPPHVLFVASEAHRAARPLFSAPLGQMFQYDHSTAMVQYSHTKLALVTWAQELRRRLLQHVAPGVPVEVETICPGPVNTGIARNSPQWLQPLVRVFMRIFASADRAAEAVVLRAQPGVPADTSRGAAHHHMAFPTPLRQDAYDAALGERLWRDTCELLSRDDEAQRRLLGVCA